MAVKTPGGKSAGRTGGKPSYYESIEDEIEEQRKVAVGSDEAGSGLSPSTIIGAEERRRQVAKRQAAVTVTGTGGGNEIADGRVMWYDPVTGEPVTWAEVKSLARQSGGWVDNTQFDPGMSIEEWYDKSGGGQSWADIFAGAIGAPVEGIDFDTGSGSSGGGGGGGGRSSAVAPTYTAPPAGTATDQVRAYVIATTGTGNQQVIDDGVAAFMAADRQAFDQQGTAQIDPWQAMKDSVRSSAAYKAVNDGRPDSVDEMDWVSGMQGKLRSIGLSAEKAETLGIAGAIGGNTDEALVDAGEMAQVQSTGRMLKSQRESLKRTAASAARLVV